VVTPVVPRPVREVDLRSGHGVLDESVELTGAVVGIVPRPQLRQPRHVPEGLLADDAERIAVQRQRPQRRTSPRRRDELDFIPAQQEFSQLGGFLEVRQVQLVQFAVGQIQVVHRGGQTAEGLAHERVVVGDEPRDVLLPDAVPTGEGGPQLVVAHIQHLQLPEVSRHSRQDLQAGQFVEAHLERAQIRHGVLVVAPPVVDERVLQTVVGDVQRRLAFHLHPGVARHEVEVHMANGQVLDFVEPGEAPVEPQHVWVADVPSGDRDVGKENLQVCCHMCLTIVIAIVHILVASMLCLLVLLCSAANVLFTKWLVL